MNFERLVDSFDAGEFKLLDKAIWERHKREAKAESVGVMLNEEEKALLKDGRRIDCIKSIRLRTDLSLMAAKNVVDRGQ
jgi:ribosomal protein L7/L12